MNNPSCLLVIRFIRRLIAIVLRVHHCPDRWLGDSRVWQQFPIRRLGYSRVLQLEGLKAAYAPKRQTEANAIYKIRIMLLYVVGTLSNSTTTPRDQFL